MSVSRLRLGANRSNFSPSGKSPHLRKAIALSLRNPENGQSKGFLKSLFGIYYDAVRASRDRRLSTGRQAKVIKTQEYVK